MVDTAPALTPAALPDRRVVLTALAGLAWKGRRGAHGIMFGGTLVARAAANASRDSSTDEGLVAAARDRDAQLLDGRLRAEVALAVRLADAITAADA